MSMRIRLARREDLPALARLLADDTLGAGRESPNDPAPYERAFDAMQAQGGNDILVAEGDDGAILGCLQLTLIPGLSRRGVTRAQIEGVRVSGAHRGARIGEALMQEAIARAKSAGCGLVQLTTDKSRADAHRFYERLGFVATHDGMKLAL
jgi:ribosomal protein S18 acetylase RimI-like enzyme